MASYLRLRSHETRHLITQARRYRLRNSLMRNQGLSKDVAKALAHEAVPPRKRTRAA